MGEFLCFSFGSLFSLLSLFSFLFYDEIANYINAKADEVRARAEKIRKENDNDTD